MIDNELKAVTQFSMTPRCYQIYKYGFEIPAKIEGLQTGPATERYTERFLIEAYRIPRQFLFLVAVWNWHLASNWKARRALDTSEIPPSFKTDTGLLRRNAAWAFRSCQVSPEKYKFVKKRVNFQLWMFQKILITI